MGCVDINVKCDGDHDDHHDHDDHDDHKKKWKRKEKDCCGPCDSLRSAPTFVGGVDVGTITPVSTELPASLLVNPAGSGKTLVVTSRTMTTIGSDDVGILFKFYFGPTVTANGAPAPVTNLKPDPMAPASVAQFWSVPTVSANGTLVDAFNVVGGNAASGVNLTLGEGQSLLVTQRANAENTRATAFLYWTECKKREHHDDDDDDEPAMPPG